MCYTIHGDLMYIKTINFTPDTNSPLYIQLSSKIEHDIAHHYLIKGDRLPSVRQLAAALNISRTTVEAAYARLCETGYVHASAKRGFFVAIDAQKAKWRESILSPRSAEETLPVRYDFSSDSVDPLCFDVSLWKRYIKEILENTHTIYSYGDIQGEPELRHALQRYAYTMRGVLCRSEQIIVGSSFQSLLYQLCGMLDKPQIIAMEAPGFDKAEQVFRDYGFSIMHIPRQPHGISLEKLKQHSITALYVHSAAIGEDKKPLDNEQRSALLAWAEKYHVMIIEDDHNGELRYASRSIPAMQGISYHRQVVYIGSFSKLLLPSLRIGYMVLNEELQRRYEKQNYSPSSSKIEQLALAHYISDGHLERQIRRSKKRYEQKSKQLMQLCMNIFPQWTLMLEEAALRIQMHAPTPYDNEQLLKQCMRYGIRLQKNKNGDLLLSFTSIDTADMEDALYIIRSVWEQLTL